MLSSATMAVTAPPEGAALDLSWQPSPGSTPDHYIVRRSLSLDGTFDLIAEPASTAYRDAPLVNGTTYFYTVEAVDAFGDASGPGAPASGTPRDRIAPAPPLLTYPTVASDLLHQDAMSVDICGKSEAGAIIDLESTDGLMAAATERDDAFRAALTEDELQVLDTILAKLLQAALRQAGAPADVPAD